ncbi:MAG: SCP2 sterol-binding domain-containing protein [Gammaproteobacteria bacterium]|nr:SCP2 sterol-binding domain-containing protein [Gammaproteobacteria bacterium]
MRIPGMFTALMQMTFDAALDGNEEAQAQCARLDGKTIAIEFSEFSSTAGNAPLYLRPRDGGIDILNAWQGGADVTLRGTIPSLLFSRLKKEGNGMPKGVSITGDAETGQDFQQLVESLDIDWEEKLSRFIGDSAAHQVGSLLRGFRDFTRQGAERFSDNIREYLQEETEDLPRRREVNEFLDNVDALREDVDRLEARVQRAFRRASNAGIDITNGN